MESVDNSSSIAKDHKKKDKKRDKKQDDKKKNKKDKSKKKDRKGGLKVANDDEMSKMTASIEAQKFKREARLMLEKMSAVVDFTQNGALPDLY